ncbi:hypothetical protein FQA39_LY18538 [Lamprigera yunnana]|nr:hypothetical protein FQA39_LY18538 [Lamprigera yunnana]
MVAAFPHVKSPTPRLDGKIVGGHPVNIEDYNYQVSLQFYGGHFCGGSILNDHVVLTAAHCTFGRPSSAFNILYGTHDLFSSGASLVSVSSILNHNDYNTVNSNNDVSLMYLSSSIQFSAAAQPTILSTTPQNGGHLRTATVSGWGYLSNGGSSPSVLHAVDVFEYPNEYCKDIYLGIITDRMICFGAPGKDSCQGDSGGPLVDVSTKEQVGIVSFGLACADPKYPGVYSNVYALKSWIDENGSK